MLKASPRSPAGIARAPNLMILTLSRSQLPSSGGQPGECPNSDIDREGNGAANDWAENAAESPRHSAPKDYLHETSFTHTATEARFAGVEWIEDRRQKLLKGPKLRRELRHELRPSRDVTTSCCHGMQRQLPPGRWCDRGEKQIRHHPFANCEAWKPQSQELWWDVGQQCRA